MHWCQVKERILDGHLRIVSDGTSAGTHVYDASGNELQYVKSITITATAHQLTSATIVFSKVYVDMVAKNAIETR